MHLCNGCLEAASFLWGRHCLSFPSVSCVLWFLCSSSELSSEYTSSGSMCLLLCVLPALFMVSMDIWITVTANEKKGKREREVVCGQVWWPILGICSLHLTHPSAHSQQWTHTRSSGQPYCGARGAVGGSVPCSRVSPQSWYWRWREHLLFTPPTDNPCRTWESNLQPLQPLGYKSNSLTIRPRLMVRLTTFAYDSIVMCSNVFSQLPLCFPGVNNKAGLGSAWDRFRPIDRTVTCQVHYGFHALIMQYVFMLSI